MISILFVCISLASEFIETKMKGNLPPHLIQLLTDVSSRMEIKAGNQILTEDQVVRVVPVVLSGLVKVITGNENRELLLYYVQPGESCVMTFTAGISGSPSKVSAFTEADSELLLIPVDKLKELLLQNPRLNEAFLESYHQRYDGLVETIQHLLFDKIDSRILDFLRDRAALQSDSLLKISHREIAQNIGTAREVVTRVMKKLEKDGRILQSRDGIELK